MCQNNLLIEHKTNKPIDIKPVSHSFKYNGLVLLDHIEMMGVINYAACHEIKDMYGVKKGYMFIVGECDESDEKKTKT